MLHEDFEKAIKKMVDDGKLGGIYQAVATGEVLEEDTTYIEVLIYGKSYYAKPCMAFGSYNIPNKEWLKEYKNEVIVWVAFENGNSAHPVYLGVCPMDGKAPKKNYPNAKIWKSVEFDYIFDDITKLFKITSKDGSFLSIDGNNGEMECKNKNGQGWKASTKTILGGGDGLKSAILGETMVQLLSQLLTTLSAATVITPAGAGTFDPAVITQLTTINSQLNTTLSSKVKLD